MCLEFVSPDPAITHAAERHLGPLHQCFGSKSGYRRAHPSHRVVFNANVCLARGKIWHGDLDLTAQALALRNLAGALGDRVYVLRSLQAPSAHRSAHLHPNVKRVGQAE